MTPCGIDNDICLAALDSLQHGVLIFDAHGVLLAANRMAVSLAGDDLAPGKKIFDYLCQGPLEHALDMDDQSVKEKNCRQILFLCGLKKDDSIHRCRLIRLDDNAAMVLHIDARVQGNTSMDQVRKKVEGLRSPLANLRAAVENLNTVDEMPQVLASAFENIITEESHILSSAFSELAEEVRREQQHERGVFPVSASELIFSLERLFTSKNITVPITGTTERAIITDSYGLMVMVSFFVEKLAERFKTVAILLHEKGDATLYLDCVWKGDPIESDLLSRWLQENLPDSCGMPLQAKDLLEHLTIAAWSQPGDTDGESLLRIPVKTVIDSERSHTLTTREVS